MFDKIMDALKGMAQNVADAREEKRRAEEESQRQLTEYIEGLRNGKLPDVRSSLLLNAGEHCYLEEQATYTRQLKNGPKVTTGVLTVTNTRLIFTAATGSWKVNLSSVMSVQGEGSNFLLQTDGSRGTGRLQVGHRFGGLITESAARLHKRLMLMPKAGRASRSIPQPVKLEVWHRDHGKCVQCSATEYLEFDHIIPHSKGGATSEANLQLLCRRCNLKKGDRI